MNKLSDSGVIDQSLALYCPSRGWALCRYRELFSRHRGEGFWFLWGPDAPVGELGWEQGRGEQSEVALATMRCCLRAFARAELSEVWRHLTNVSGEPELLAFEQVHAPPRIIRQFYAHELPAFYASGEQSGRPVRTMLLPLAGVGVQRAMAIGVAAIGVLCWLACRRPAAVIALGALAFVLLNAVVVGLLNQYTDRLVSRVAWLLPYGGRSGCSPRGRTVSDG